MGTEEVTRQSLLARIHDPLITEFTAHGGTVATVTFLPNGDFITGGRDSRVHCWRMADVLEYVGKLEK